ncbi:pyridoxal 5'-phosphate synthase glutaminase subunit PdxT [Microcella alkaliphila]|uniref:Pyridoxal 5'-phosphate synthase subunit PdxT n=1 Tax=Microcella alkaliphila TaxID=279828 RepID=A0A0U5BD98_9MICO|nr:pyridoxal 5'-phosphate synthase glutaminase subunit PdxT [Microcella alkaliphila]BAU32223.1 glutamine amidotransferase subunit PdxT [Microcella alkaliphila]
MAGNTPPVGVLALQGDVREHLAALASLGADARPVKSPADLEQVAGLVIPGGESSVIDKLSRIFEVRDPIRARIAGGMPVYGTCAGLIMLADDLVDGIAGQQTFGGFDATVRRNAFGTQLDSFETELAIPALGEHPMHAVFIRAPVVERVGPGVDVLARVDDGRIVAIEQGPLLGTAFHPEVAGEFRFHARFLERVRAAS